MEAYAITRRLLAAIKDLSLKRQEQMLELARAWASPTAAEGDPQGPAALLQTSGRLDQDYLDLARSELQSPPDLATVRAALAGIPGSLTVDCIAERDER